MKLQILLTISTLLLSCVHSANGDIVAGYVPAWKDVSNIDPSKFTHVNIAFAEPLANGTLSFESSFVVPEFVDKAKKAGTRVLLGLGGWSGSIYFSDILKSPDTRSKLISEVAEFVKSNHLDGVDMDWITNECNKADIQNDASNLLVFLQELRQKLDSGSVQYKPTVSLGVGIKPFVGPNGPLEDVSEYANLVDYIAILAYDMNSSQSNTTGPNAPLNYELGRGVQYSLISAIDSWTKAKFPADKILAGIAFYGRSLTTETDMSAEAWNLYQPHEEAVPRGDDDDGLWADKCSNKPPSYSGIWSYNNLRRQHVLNSPEAAESPWRRYWDSISLTPWVFNPVSKTFISYDDQASIRAKLLGLEFFTDTSSYQQ
ncbi:hypothetical protein EDC05_006411 [Coemansia umbellata]|uniref:GH18 domain-containing protein n=1 Tax=Coemansia umbellata TaxID=1424467 RepID=A0ABQ8PCV4_9FUNG|nr:hypothetical protein EDC05_006411 [Coemansia umbellata]